MAAGVKLPLWRWLARAPAAVTRPRVARGAAAWYVAGAPASIFTPNVRYLEVVEDGIEAGDVMPARGFEP